MTGKTCGYRYVFKDCDVQAAQADEKPKNLVSLNSFMTSDLKFQGCSRFVLGCFC
jgi:hypothetical protein